MWLNAAALFLQHKRHTWACPKCPVRSAIISWKLLILYCLEYNLSCQWQTTTCNITCTAYYIRKDVSFWFKAWFLSLSMGIVLVSTAIVLIWKCWNDFLGLLLFLYSSVMSCRKWCKGRYALEVCWFVMMLLVGLSNGTSAIPTPGCSLLWFCYCFLSCLIKSVSPGGIKQGNWLPPL